MTSEHDIQHMRSALALARTGLGRTWPNPSVGCVIVDKHGHVVARARTADGGRPHAEELALKQAGPEAKGGTAYVSFEPCAHHGQTPPCTGHLIEAGGRVVVACEDPDPRVAGEGLRQLHAAGIEVETGILEAEARALNAGFIFRLTKNRPFVTLKSAVSNDGKITDQKGKTRKITGEFSDRLVHLQRARHDAVMVGIGTVLADDPMLNARVPGLAHQTVRVVLDSHLRIPVGSKLVESAGDFPLWIFHTDDPEDKAGTLRQAGARLFRGTEAEDVCCVLAEEGITRLFVEGGAEVHTSFLKAGLCDRFLLFKADKVFGENGVDALAGHDVFKMAGEFGLRLEKTEASGEDLLEIYRKRD